MLYYCVATSAVLQRADGIVAGRLCAGCVEQRAGLTDLPYEADYGTWRTALLEPPAPVFKAGHIQGILPEERVPY